jgi:hypothetical protein
MADDQATLGSFAEDEAGGTDDEATDRAAGTRATAPALGDSDADGLSGPTEMAGGAAAEPGEELVCPWCLAPGDRFVEAGPTGLACGRCSAALPADAGWFRAREVVARRPMYETGD